MSKCKAFPRSAKIFLVCIKFDKGGNCEYSLKSLNFVVFMEPNKHKTGSEGFSTTWPNLFSNTFATVGEF